MIFFEIFYVVPYLCKESQSGYNWADFVPAGLFKVKKFRLFRNKLTSKNSRQTVSVKTFLKMKTLLHVTSFQKKKKSRIHLTLEKTATDISIKQVKIETF